MKKIMIGILSALMAISMVFSLTGTSFIVADTVPQQDKTEIKLGGLFPLTGRLMAGGVERDAAARLAVAQINNDSDILPNHTIKLLVKDTATDTTTGTTVAKAAVTDGAVGIIGAASSGVSQVVAQAVSDTNTPVVSYSSTAASLSNTTAYPNFARVAPPDSLQAAALAQYLVGQGVTEVATLASSDAYGKGGITEFLNALPDNVTVATSQEFMAGGSDVSSQLKAIKDSGATVVVLNVVIEDAKTVFNQAADAGLSAKDDNITWYGTDGVVQTDVYTDEDGKLVQAVVDAAGDLIGTRGFTDTTLTEYKAFLDLWEKSDNTTYAGAGDRDPNFYATYAYDAVYLYAHALHKMVTDGTDYEDGTLLFTELLNTSFNGATGLVNLDSSGDRIAPFEVVKLESNATAVKFNVQTVITAERAETTSDSPFGIIAFVGVFVFISVVSAVFARRRRR